MARTGTSVTGPTDGDVEAFISAVTHEGRRADASALSDLMADVTGERPVLWGASIVGFGSYHYTYASGRQGNAPLVGFSPRADASAVYLVGGFAERYPALLERLGPHRAAKGCLYLKRLADVDIGVLRHLIERTVRVHRGADSPPS